LIDNWSWANGEAILRSGNSLLGLPLRDLVDATYRLMTIWACQDEAQRAQIDRIDKHFRDREEEYETGIPVLPGWASIGDVASRYGVDDGADPFSTSPVEPDSEES
jgi:hypothetical protein